MQQRVELLACWYSKFESFKRTSAGSKFAHKWAICSKVSNLLASEQLERSQKYKYSFCAYSNSPVTSAKCDFPQKNANLCNQRPPICTRLEHARQILALPVLIFANFCVGFVLLKYTTRDPKSKHPPNNNRASTHLQCYLAVHMYSSTCSLYDILQSTRWCNQRRAVDKASDHCAVQQTSSSARCRSFMQFSWIN